MTVTIFNRLGEDEEGNARYKACVFRNVYIETKVAANPVYSGERNNNNFRLYLFTERGYLPREDFLRNPEGHWTLHPGDLLTTGIHEIPPENPYRINTINVFYAKEKFHHWEVSGRGQLLES